MIRKYLKKLIPYLLILVLLVSAAGCGRKQTDANSAAGTQSTSEATSGTDASSEESQEELSLIESPESGESSESSDGNPEDDLGGLLTHPMEEESVEDRIREDGEYTSKEEVAAYIHLFGKLPKNYITKKKAEELGWSQKKGNLWKVAPGKSIGGSRFGNYEGLLPEAKNRKYYECDIDYEGGYRNDKRIVYSNDGLIYYTDNHYNSFEALYE